MIVNKVKVYILIEIIYLNRKKNIIRNIILEFVVEICLLKQCLKLDKNGIYIDLIESI